MSTLIITRIAHSSVLIDFDGHRVLTDPWFSERFGYYHSSALQFMPAGSQSSLGWQLTIDEVEIDALG